MKNEIIVAQSRRLCEAGVFMGRTDNIEVRYAAGIGLLFYVFMVVVAIVAIIITVPKTNNKTNI